MNINETFAMNVSYDGYFSGYAGMQIKVGNRPILLNRIGRYFGNSTGATTAQTTHTVIVLEGSRNLEAEQIIAYGIITLGHSYTTNLFRYDGVTPYDGSHPSDWLTPGRVYYITCYEDKNNNNDSPYGVPDDISQVKSGSAVRFLAPAIGTDSQGAPAGLQEIRMNPGNPSIANPQSFGPLNLLYTQQAQTTNWALFNNPQVMTNSMVTSSVQGYRGIRITTGANPLMVTDLGRLKFAGNQKAHRLMIQKCIPAPLDTLDTTNQPILAEVVASAVVDLSPAGLVANQYAYAPLPRPVVLEPNTSYYLASYEDTSSGGDSHATGGSDNLNTDISGHLGLGFTVNSTPWVCANGGSWQADTGSLKSNVNFRIQ